MSLKALLQLEIHWPEVWDAGQWGAGDFSLPPHERWMTVLEWVLEFRPETFACFGSRAGQTEYAHHCAVLNQRLNCGALRRSAFAANKAKDNLRLIEIAVGVN